MQKFGELLLYKCSVKLDHWTVEPGEGEIEMELSNSDEGSDEGIEVIAFEVEIVIEKEWEGRV
jgi:hypothetical protein